MGNRRPAAERPEVHGPAHARGEAALNSLKWPRWLPEVRVAVAKACVPGREYRRLTRDLIALLSPWDASQNRIIGYLTNQWWLKSIEVRMMKGRPQMPFDTSRLDPIIESYLDAYALELTLGTRKWRYRLEKCLETRVESFAKLRETIELRLAMFQEPRDAPQSARLAGSRSAAEIGAEFKGSLTSLGKSPSD